VFNVENDRTSSSQSSEDAMKETHFWSQLTADLLRVLFRTRNKLLSYLSHYSVLGLGVAAASLPQPKLSEGPLLRCG
jgi:hypothetical protein